MVNPIIVVGGGVAGAATCLSIAQAGDRPLWLSPPVGAADDRVGESLSPAANTFLAELGVNSILTTGAHRQSHTVYSSWGSDRLIQRHSIQHLEGPGLVLNRDRFEADLVAEATKAVDRVFQSVASANRVGDHWLVTTEAGASHRGRFVVDCSGRTAIIGRNLASRQRVDQLIAAYAFLRQKSDDVEPTPATLIEAVRDGWWYASLLPDGRLTLNYYSDPDLMPRDVTSVADRWQAILAGTQYIAQWVGSAEFDPSPLPRRASAGTTFLSTVAGDGWAAAGDAAAAFDPLSSHGITSALWSGLQAGRAAVAYGHDDHAPLKTYADAVQAGITAYLTQRKAVYGSEIRFADAPFWQRRIGDPQPA